MFDLVCILIIIAGVVLGLRRGFMAQIGSFVGVIAGIIICRIFGPELASAFVSPEDSESTRLLHSVLAYVVLFGVCYLGGRLIGKAMSGTIDALHLSWLDKIAGAVLKLCEYLLAFSLLLNLWIAIFPDTQLRSSKDGLSEFVVDFAPVILGSELADEFMKGTESLSDSLQKVKNGMSADNDSTVEPSTDN